MRATSPHYAEFVRRLARWYLGICRVIEQMISLRLVLFSIRLGRRSRDYALEIVHHTEDFRGQAYTIESIDASTRHNEVNRSSRIDVRRFRAHIGPFFCVAYFKCLSIFLLATKPTAVNFTIDAQIEFLPRIMTFSWPLSSR